MTEPVAVENADCISMVLEECYPGVGIYCQPKNRGQTSRLAINPDCTERLQDLCSGTQRQRVALYNRKHEPTTAINKGFAAACARTCIENPDIDRLMNYSADS